MGNEGIQLFINVCILLIVLIIAQIFLKRWDKKAKAEEAAAEPKAKGKKK